MCVLLATFTSAGPWACERSESFLLFVIGVNGVKFKIYTYNFIKKIECLQATTHTIHIASLSGYFYESVIL